jgi:chromosome transmission fidelity protein 1
LSDPTEPEWVSRQILEKHKRELEQAEADLEERLQTARQHEEKMRQQESGRSRKRAVGGYLSCRLATHEYPALQKLAHGEPKKLDESDDSFLPDAEPGEDEEDNISPAVRALMQK